MSRKKAPARPPTRTKRPARRSTPRKEPETPRFVGRDPSPVLDHYPPKDPALSVRGPPSPPRQPPPHSPVASPSTAPPPAAAPPPPGGAAAPPPKDLILLEKPFDLDEFSRLLGETKIRIEVPREDLAEALRRIADFMGFGIYVYAFRVRPAPEETLKRFVVELERVDYSASSREWTPFVEKGRSESPFGPTGERR